MVSNLLERKATISPEDHEQIHFILTGEIRLLAAVIKQAMYEWLVYRNSKDARLRKLAEKARRWIFHKIEDGGEHSFNRYCLLVGIDPAVVRQRICDVAIQSGCKANFVLRERYPFSD